MQVDKIYIGCDHAGYEVKEKLKQYLTKKMGYTVEDCGTNSLDSVDYPDFAHKVSSGVASVSNTYGILICGTGNGVCMTANKRDGIRAGLVWEAEIAALIRQHNDANVLCMPARFISYRKMIQIVKTYFSTEFEGGRHQRRVDKIHC